MVKRQIQTYERHYGEQVRLCRAGYECPYCGGTFRGISRRIWCCKEAMLWKRKQKRGRIAEMKGRKAGQMGRPRKKLIGLDSDGEKK